MIALALVLRPAVVVADEPTTALDVLVEAQILRIIADLRRNFDTALLLITHNLGIVAEACDRVAVMYAGRIVEQGSAYDVTTKPSHPYSRELLRSTISLSTTKLHSIPGAPPNLVHPPAGLPVPPALPGRDEGLRRAVAADDHHRPGAPLGVLAARQGRHPRGPGGTARARGAGRRGGSMSATATATKTLMEVRDLQVHFALHETLQVARHRPRRRRGQGRRRRLVRPAGGRGPRPGRRVRLGQDDARPRAARPRAPDRRQRQAARRGARRPARAPAAAQAPAPADGLPGPARVAEPGHDAWRPRSRTRCRSTS